jgi:chemotaxis protein MotB
MNSAKAAAESATKSRDEIAAKLADAQKKLTDLQSERDDAVSKASKLQQNLESTEAQLSKLKATADSLQDKLKAEISRGDIKLSQSGDRIQVDMVDKILFDSGEANLQDRGKEVLGRVAAVLKTVDDKVIQVSGHTDDSPIKDEKLKAQFPSNWELSAARAVNVVRYLTETGKVPARNVIAAGYGQWHPVTTNANPKGRAANRRIEILLTPQVVPQQVAKKK